MIVEERNVQNINDRRQRIGSDNQKHGLMMDGLLAYTLYFFSNGILHSTSLLHKSLEDNYFKK
jgi:hypothetical protein